MADTRLLSAERIAALRASHECGRGMNIIDKEMFDHITAQAEQIKELTEIVELSATAHKKLLWQILGLQENCEEIPGYIAEAETHREMLKERDAKIVALREELDRTNEITIEVMRERDEARNNALDEAAQMIDENYSQTLADAIRALKTKEGTCPI